jgi:predicted transcriptional regulator
MGVKFWEYSSRNRKGHEMHPLVKVHREAILIMWKHGWTEENIAAKVGLDVDTIGRHLREARKAGDPRAEVRHAATRMAMEAAQ